ncbi:MAG: metallophosphoesterase family protein [Cyclobacteriaceae bacterium]
MKMNKHSYTIDRRTFLKLTGLGASSMFMPSCLFSSKPRIIKFGLVTDSHYADREPNGKRYYRESLDKMRECIAVFNREKVAFAIHLGDFKDQDLNERSEDTLSYLRAIEAIYGEFQGPRYHCVGNHDVDSIRKGVFLANIENTGISNKDSYYSFDNSGYHFVVLDANYSQDGTDHYYKDGVDWQNTNIPSFELDWFRNDLKSTDLPTIVFCHHPIYPFPSRNHNLRVNNFEAVQQIMNSSGKVIAAFQGHVHKEDYMNIDGIHYSTQLAMVDHSGMENNSFSIVTIDEKQIQIDGYKRVVDQKYLLS